MLTIESLKAYGANVEEGLRRCLNNEAFYLGLMKKVLEDKNFDRLRDAMVAKDSPAAFEAAHALKGIVGNMALTPIYEPVCQLTELLRGKSEPVDGDALVEQIMDQLEKLRLLCS